jgi:tRNA threonylcarbamoyladenosine biosynthesis protein TsaB
LGEKFSNDQKTHSEKLLPLIDELLKEFKLKISDIDLFIVSVGPGSFTGIRIGVSTIKGIAQALNKNVISVTSLEGLIEMTDNENVCAMINARHENIYYQIKYKGELKEADCKNINEIIEELKLLDENFIIVGDATIEFEEKITENLNCEIFEKKIQSSSDIAKFGLNKYFGDEKSAKNANEIIPFYLRKAQPDREV